MTKIDIHIQKLSSEIGMDKEELVRQSLLLFTSSKLKDIKKELYSLQQKYNVNTVFEFEKLYELGKIEESETFLDYQKFDRLSYEKEVFEKQIKKLSYR